MRNLDYDNFWSQWVAQTEQSDEPQSTKVPKVRYYRKLRDNSFFFRIVVRLIRLYVKLKCRRFSEGEENLPEKGGVIVIAPHLGSIDACLPTEFVTRCGRAPRIMAKKSLWKIPIVKQAFNSGNLIPVERESNRSVDALKTARQALIDGDVVFIFPEGTYTKDPDHWPMTCKAGAAKLALMTNVPVVPILQDGEQFMIKSQKSRTDLPWYKRYHIKSAFGRVRPFVHLKGYPPIDFSDIFTEAVAKPSDELIAQVNARIEQTLTTMTEISRDAKAPARWDPRVKGRL